MIYLYVSTFGQDTSWIKAGKKNVCPIEVGACCRKNNESIHYELRDDIGYSISKDNPLWGELSGLYWIWKNVEFNDNDIIGFCHYNKRLDISDQQIEKFFKESKSNSWIVCSPSVAPPHTYPEDMLVLEQVLKEQFTNYYKSWKKLYHSNGASKDGKHTCSGGELFYTDKTGFEQYCKFLFDVLFEVKDRIGDVEREPYHRRYLAFMGERLLSVFLLTNSVNSKHVIIYFNNISFVRKFLRKMSYILGLNRDSKWFIKLRKLLFADKQTSSYLTK